MLRRTLTRARTHMCTHARSFTHRARTHPRRPHRLPRFPTSSRARRCRCRCQYRCPLLLANFARLPRELTRARAHARARPRTRSRPLGFASQSCSECTCFASFWVTSSCAGRSYLGLSNMPSEEKSSRPISHRHPPGRCSYSALDCLCRMTAWPLNATHLG